MNLLEGPGNTGKVVKVTAVGTAVIGILALQILVFRVGMDVVSSVGLFGLGYAYRAMKK